MGHAFEKFIYLPFNLKFIVFMVSSLTLAYIVSTYDAVFHEFPGKTYVMIQSIVVLAIDVVAGFIHKSNPTLANKREYKSRSSLVIFLETVLVIFTAISVFSTSTSSRLLLVVNPLRIWKILYCYLMTSNIVGQASMTSLLIKFFTFSIIVVHTLSCFWYKLMLYEESLDLPSWKILVETQKSIPTNVWEWYIVCVYFVTNTFTTIGFGDIVGITDIEKVFSLIVMVVGYIFVTGLFLAAFTTFLTLKYTYYADFKQRRSLIHQSFDEDCFPKEITSKSIKLFYDRYWLEEEGICDSELLKKLPTKIQEMVSYDIFKAALNACPLLEDLPIAVKKTLSRYVTIQIFLPGWKIIKKEDWVDTCLYIHYGVAQILTDEDDESSVFPVGLGSCISASTLILSRRSKVHINAATYCITHQLKRSDLFSVLKHYIGTNQLVINRFKVLKHTTNSCVYSAYEIQDDRKKLDVFAMAIGPGSSYGVGKKRLLILLYNNISYLIIPYGLMELKNNLDELMNGITISKEKVWFAENSVEMQSQLETTHLTEVCKQLVHMNYIPAVETEEIMKDDACIKTDFPWVIEPNSPFLKFWGYLVVSTALLASLLIPYFAAFYRDIPQQVGLVFTYINIVYVIDLIFVCITAQEMSGGRVSKSKEILKLKVKGGYFIVDVIGSLPLDILVIFLDLETGRRMRPLFKLNQLIGMVKVHKFFTRMEYGFEVNLLALRITKYILYFTVMSYWFGSIYYAMACFNIECSQNSWFVNLVNTDQMTVPNKVKHKFPFEISIYFGLLVITQTAFGDISAYNSTEMIVLHIFCFVGTFLFCYLISDYSSTLTLQGSYKQAFVQFMNIMVRILENNKLPTTLKFRVLNFMYLQWQHRQGYTVLHEEDIMWDLPERLKKDMKREHIHKELKSVSLLDAIGDEFIAELSLLVETYMIPPNEVMFYAGSVCNEFYLIEEGNCQMIDGKNRVVRIIEAQESFNLFEMILGLRSIYNVRTATHCRVISITKEQINRVINLLNIQSFSEQLQLRIDDLYSSPEMLKLRIHKAIRMSETVEENIPSGFLFSAGHRAHPNIDYLEPFNRFGFLSGLRFILMPITINPNGPFMWWWEIFRGLCAFLSSMIFPILPYISIFYPHIIWLPIFLDASALADLYLRLHTCYYNENGLLVLHPLSTAIHYFKSGFIIDLIAWIPLNYFLPFRPYSKRPGFNWINEPLDLIRFNRLLQMHRLISWFVYQEKQILRNTLFITFTKYFLISIVFLNTLASWLEILTVNFIYNPETKEVDWEMLKNKNSWIYTYRPEFQLSSLSNILNVHVIAYYWTASVALSIGPGDISAQNSNEMFFVCWVVMLGFLYYTYVLVIIANAKASIDLNLTIYQERMQSLVGFMRNEDVSRDLQKLAIQHFERVWQRTRGVALRSMFTKVSVTLREDCLLQIYEETFLKVTAFKGVKSAFFRELAVLVEELYFIKGEAVVRQNDVISSVLIVHCGVVAVVDCVGMSIKTLECGSIFGNFLQDSPAMRSNFSYIVEKNADILRIPVTDFFRIAQKFQKITSTFENYIYDGLTFISAQDVCGMISTAEEEENITIKEVTVQEDGEEFWNEKKAHKGYLKWIIRFATIVHGPFLTTVESFFNLISVVLCSYDLAFQSEDLFGMIYTLEALFIIVMISRFFKSYEDPVTGEIETDLRKISLRYLKEPTGFIFDFIINFPLGLILYYTVSHYAMTWANVLHLFRLLKVFKFFEVKSDRLNVKVVYIKVLLILITFTLLAHIFACIWNVVHCPRNVCHTKFCDNNYLCALYYTVVTLTSTGYGDVGPSNTLEYLYVVMMIIGSRFIFAIFLGDITNAIQTHNYSFLTYEFQLSMLNKYLHVYGVTSNVHNNVVDYCTRLWQGYNGEQIPIFFKQANSCLQQDLSMEIYGYHMTESFLFVGLHKDLLRQIICFCNQNIYHPGGIIAQENQVDDKMFIIHKGSVISTSSTINNETTLKERDFFGVPQGLYHDTPHTRTYKAISVCVILELCLLDWEYLLDFFPASKVELYDRATRLEKICEDIEYQDELEKLRASSLMLNEV